jgi:hypothetical protein
VRLVAIWNRWWFAPVPVRRLALFRIAVCAWAIADLVGPARYIGRFSAVDDEFRSPILLLRIPHIAAPSAAVFTAVHVALVVALVFALVGLFTRAALLVAVPLYLYFFAEFYSYHAVEHGRVAVALALIALAIAPSGAALSLDARRRHLDESRVDPLAGWALRVVQVVVVAAYSVAGLTKVAVQQLRWPTDGALLDALTDKATSLGGSLAEHTTLIIVLGFMTLALELAAPLVFVGRRWRDVILVSTALFHIAVIFTLDIWFLGLMVCYLAFYDLEVGHDRVRGWLARQRRAVPGTTRRMNV